MWFALCVAVREFGVQTEVIQADFSGGRPIYEDIAKGLQGKEIGILGEFCPWLLRTTLQDKCVYCSSLAN